MSATTTAICVIVMGTAGGTIRAPLPLAIRYLLGCSQLGAEQPPPGRSIRSERAHLLVIEVSAPFAGHGKPCPAIPMSAPAPRQSPGAFTLRPGPMLRRVRVRVGGGRRVRW